MSDINLVFIQYGTYMDLPIIKEIVNKNINRLKPKTVTFLNMDDLQNLCKDSLHFQKFKDAGCFASDVARLLYLQAHPNTLYLDLDCLLSEEDFNFISEHSHDSFIGGWSEKDPHTGCSRVHACSGILSYRGDSRSEFFDKMLEEYEESAKTDKNFSTDIDIADKVGLSAIESDSPFIIGKSYDTFLFKPKQIFHMGATRFIRNCNILKLAQSQIAYSFDLKKCLTELMVWCPAILILDPYESNTFDVHFQRSLSIFVELCPKELMKAFVDTLKLLLGENMTFMI